MAWKFDTEVNRSWTFDVGELRLAIGNQFFLKRLCFVGVSGHGDKLNHCLDLFAKIFVGHAEDGDINNLGVSHQSILGFLWVDVDST